MNSSPSIRTRKDLALITDLITSLPGRFTVDATRVFARGCSSGAFMVNQVACRKPALLRGIAAHSGGAPAPSQDPSSGYGPNGYAKCGERSSGVAALVVHGSDDGVVAPQSGDFAAK